MTARGGRPAEPVILPFAPRQGWERADWQRRVLATWCVMFVVGWIASIDVPQEEFGAWAKVLGSLVLFGGPPACYSLARVLRPHPPGTGRERQARHWCAAIATAYGATLLLTHLSALHSPRCGLPLNDAVLLPDTTVLYIVAASVLGSATLIWGVIAAAVRAALRNPRAAHSPV